MENKKKTFLILSVGALLILLGLTGGVLLLNEIATLGVYKLINVILLIGIGSLITVFFLASITLYITFLGKKLLEGFTLFYNIGMKVVMPVFIYVCAGLGFKKDDLRNFYIDINNNFIKNKDIKVKPERILVILPHCLQNAECTFKITNDSSNCEKCGRCGIGDILDVVERTKVKLIIVTGGTAARASVIKARPKLIIAVACERDLTSGIKDVMKIPVIGIKNMRPNGPCYNTCMDVSLLEKCIVSHSSI